LRAAVIDASVAIKWVAPEDFSTQALSLLNGPQLFAPAHWLSEAVNGVWGKFHRGQWSAPVTRARAAALMQAPIKPVALPELMERAIERAITLRLTVYDSLYISLAEARGIPLITDDGKLLRRMSADPALSSLAQPLASLPLS
jgi:predicted nucleic acid-binding protein